MGFLRHLRSREKAWKWLQEQSPMWEKLTVLQSEDSWKWCSTSWDTEQVEERRARQQNVWTRMKSQENDLRSRVWRDCVRVRLPRARAQGRGLCLGKTWAKRSPETPLQMRDLVMGRAGALQGLLKRQKDFPRASLCQAREEMARLKKKPRSSLQQWENALSVHRSERKRECNIKCKCRDLDLSGMV